MNKKILFTIAFCTFLLIALSPVVFAVQQSILARAGNAVLDFATLKFLNNNQDKLAAFMRILVWILVFTVIYAVVGRLNNTGGMAGAGGAAFFTRSMGITLAAVIATISSVFISPEILLGLGEAYGTIVAAIFVGGFTLAVWWALYRFFPNNLHMEGRMLYFCRVIVLILLILILENITGWVSNGFPLISH
jgi:hypothetical protein